MIITFKDGFEIETDSIISERNIAGENPGIKTFSNEIDYTQITEKYKWIKDNCVSDVRIFRKKQRIFVFEDQTEAIAFELTFM